MALTELTAIDGSPLIICATAVSTSVTENRGIVRMFTQVLKMTTRRYTLNESDSD